MQVGALGWGLGCKKKGETGDKRSEGIGFQREVDFIIRLKI